MTDVYSTTVHEDIHAAIKDEEDFRGLTPLLYHDFSAFRREVAGLRRDASCDFLIAFHESLALQRLNEVAVFESLDHGLLRRCCLLASFSLRYSSTPSSPCA